MVFRYHTRFFYAEKFDLKYQTEDGVKVGYIRRKGSSEWKPISSEEVEIYIKQWYRNKKKLLGVPSTS